MKQKIDDFLEVPPVDGVIEIDVPVRRREKNTPAPTEQDFVDDFNYARNTLHDLIETGSKALSGAMGVAESTQHPRAFEVASTLLGQVSGAAKDLLSLTETASKITAKPVSEGEKKDDSVFIGSTQDLKKLLSGDEPLKGDNE